MISACSFQEKTLRDSKNALLGSFNHHLGGIEGRGIGFEESADEKGRLNLKHSFINFHGYHEIKGLENKILILLLMSWFAADQFRFYFRQMVQSRAHGFDQLRMTIVSDKLSGDDDFRRTSEENLRNLIDPANNAAQLVLTRSTTSDQFSGDLLADNLAGWLNNAMVKPDGQFGSYARDLIATGVWTGWYQLQPSTSLLERLPAVNRLN